MTCLNTHTHTHTDPYPSFDDLCFSLHFGFFLEILSLLCFSCRSAFHPLTCSFSSPVCFHTCVYTVSSFPLSLSPSLDLSQVRYVTEVNHDFLLSMRVWINVCQSCCICMYIHIYIYLSEEKIRISSHVCIVHVYKSSFSLGLDSSTTEKSNSDTYDCVSSLALLFCVFVNYLYLSQRKKKQENISSD